MSGREKNRDSFSSFVFLNFPYGHVFSAVQKLIFDFEVLSLVLLC